MDREDRWEDRWEENQARGSARGGEIGERENIGKIRLQVGGR